MDKQHRQLRLLGATRTFRTAKFEDREHLVVPTVMLVEGVIWPVNATFPELVLAEEFSKKPDSWNGRPLVPNHPDENGKKVSANHPQILETLRFGQLFETKVKGKELWTESWIDQERALKVSGASDLVERIKAGEPIEISTGTWLTIEEAQGDWNGKKFKGIWRDIVGDHLAMFPEGITGACSNEMGCGLRAAEANILTRNGVIHVRTEDEQKVEPVITSETRAAACSCGGHMEKKDRIKALIENKKTPWSADDQAYLEGMTEERLKAAEQNAEEVSAAPGPQPSTPPPTQPAPKPQSPPQPTPAPQPNPQPDSEPEEEAKELTEEEFLAKFPNVKRIVDEHAARAAAEKTQLVGQLKAAQKAYTEQELNAMEVPQLKKLSQLVTAKATTDFSARGPRVAEDRSTVPPPPKLADKLKALKQ